MSVNTCSPTSLPPRADMASCRAIWDKAPGQAQGWNTRVTSYGMAHVFGDKDEANDDYLLFSRVRARGGAARRPHLTLSSEQETQRRDPTTLFSLVIFSTPPLPPDESAVSRNQPPSNPVQTRHFGIADWARPTRPAPRRLWSNFPCYSRFHAFIE